MARKDKPMERSIKVGGDANAIAVRARDHTFVELIGDDGLPVTEWGGAVETGFGVSKGSYVVRSDGAIEDLEATTVESLDSLKAATDSAALALDAQCPESHPVDGVPELPADGRATCTLTVEKRSATGEPLHRRLDKDEVFLRSTGGTLEDKSGKRLRSVRLSSGRAEFRLRSEEFPRTVTVEAFGAPPLGRAEVRIEFV